MTEMSPQISIDRDALSAFYRRHGIKRLALFGSVPRDDFSPDSDVDVLVEFQPGHVPGLDFVSMEREFSQLSTIARPTRRYGYAEVPQRANSRPGLEERRTSLCRRVISSTSDTLVLAISQGRQRCVSADCHNRPIS